MFPVYLSEQAFPYHMSMHSPSSRQQRPCVRRIAIVAAATATESCWAVEQ